MNTKRLSNVITAFILIILFGSCSAAVKNSYDFEKDSYIFTQMSDFDFLNEYVVDENLKDDNIDKLKIKENLALEIKYNKETFKVYAYVFESIEDSLEYGERISGNNYYSWYEDIQKTSFYYHGTTDFFGIYVNRISLIISNDKSIFIEGNCSLKEYLEFLTFVIQKLPEKVEYSY